MVSNSNSKAIIQIKMRDNDLNKILQKPAYYVTNTLNENVYTNAFLQQQEVKIANAMQGKEGIKGHSQASIIMDLITF